ncbi:MAG: SAM-dependent methyltransferase [Pseudomonadota bacterium]
MTPLEALIKKRIAATGPITLAEYMAECLMHPEHGYYTSKDPLGAAGDFTTAPEISQMFGELLGLALAQAWMDRGAPAPFRLIELGPGRGSLMADLLRATAGVPGFHDAMRLHLVETSPALRQRQAETVSRAFQHHDRLEDVPDGPLFLIANEFFDALPVRQFQRVEQGWRERVLGLSDGRLSLGLSDPMPVLEDRLEDTKPGDIVETSPAAQAVAETIGARIAEHGGIALIIDYGDWRALGDTLQAVRNHETVDPLSTPGEADLTAHVDFEAIATAATPAQTTRLTPQGVLLERLGITARAQALAQKLAGAALDSHIAAHRRLTHPQEMGTLFKAIALTQKGSPVLPGFAP